jgi:single-strand DNA-binding protein
VNIGPMNIVVVQGTLSRPAQERVLESGDRMVAYDVTVRNEGERADTVPVVWFAAPPSAADLAVDTEVVVTGRVRRRFFRAGGATQSRTEVVADAVVPTRQRKKAQAALDTALDDLCRAVEPAATG